MAAVTLAFTSEQEYLGFDVVDAQIEDAHVGDVVSVNYDFGAGIRKIVGEFEGTETRDSGEVFVWVREADKTHTRYAIPEAMVETLRIEARKESLPTVETAAARVTPKRARAHRTLDGLPSAAYGRACARLDYEGAVID
jgi:hypothetical protein